MTQEQKEIRAKVGVLELAKQLGNVSQACRIMGFSRGSFHRFKDLYANGAGTRPEAMLQMHQMQNRAPHPCICSTVRRPGPMRWGASAAAQQQCRSAPAGCSSLT